MQCCFQIAVWLLCALATLVFQFTAFWQSTLINTFILSADHFGSSGTDTGFTLERELLSGETVNGSNLIGYEAWLLVIIITIRPTIWLAAIILSLETNLPISDLSDRDYHQRLQKRKECEGKIRLTDIERKIRRQRETKRSWGITNKTKNLWERQLRVLQEHLTRSVLLFQNRPNTL